MHLALQKLDTRDTAARLAAAEAFLERYERKQLHGKDSRQVLGELLDFACKERQSEVQATLFEALDLAMAHYQGDHAADFEWKVLIEALPRLHDESLALALPLLSISGHPDARKAISTQLQHKDKDVREAASFALDELALNGY